MEVFQGPTVWGIDSGRESHTIGGEASEEAFAVPLAEISRVVGFWIYFEVTSLPQFLHL